jgi:DNA-directed RNA polymerase subunit RPC12/RpoP
MTYRCDECKKQVSMVRFDLDVPKEERKQRCNKCYWKQAQGEKKEGK